MCVCVSCISLCVCVWFGLALYFKKIGLALAGSHFCPVCWRGSGTDLVVASLLRRALQCEPRRLAMLAMYYHDSDACVQCQRIQRILMRKHISVQRHPLSYTEEIKTTSFSQLRPMSCQPKKCCGPIHTAMISQYLPKFTEHSKK